MRADIRAAVAVALACAPTVCPAQSVPPAAVQVVADPIVGPIRAGDVIRVVTAGTDKYNGDFRIETDGIAAIPRLGGLPLSGLSTTQAAEAIAARIKTLQLLKKPDVTVVIVARKAREAIVSGAVQNQGRQVLREGTLLSDVLEAAVPAPLADLSHILLRREGVDRIVDYRRFRSGLSAETDLNPALQDGDRIYVYLSEPAAGSVRVIGEVKDATKTTLPITGATTVGQALQQLGGLTEWGDPQRVFVQRGETRLPVRYDAVLRNEPGADFLLLDRDELHVPRLERRREALVGGAVRSAGAVSLTGRTSLLQAIAQAGGLAEGARRKEILLRRPTPGGGVRSVVYNLEKDSDASTEVLPGDYIEVPFGGRRSGIDFNQAVGTLVGVASLFSFFRR